MAAADFPNAPSVGDTFTAGSFNYVWNGTTWTASKSVAIPAAVDMTLYVTNTALDAKLASLVTGLSHSTAVIAIESAPPATPVADEFYIVGASPTGAWAGKVHQIAYWDGKAWVFVAPQAGEARLVEKDKATFSWNGTAWVKIASGPQVIQSMPKATYDGLTTKDSSVLYMTY